jgi:putative RNA 2'-phosphotransferase
MPPAALYGAVPARYADRTDVVGLAPRKQRFIHLHTDRAGAREASSRRDQDPVLFRIAAHEAHEAGVQFYPRGEGIWLSDPIPPAFLTRLVDDGGEGERRAKRLARPGDPGYRRRRPRGGFAKPRERNSHG